MYGSGGSAGLPGTHFGLAHETAVSLFLSLTLAGAASRQTFATASSLDGVREARISSAGPALATAKAVVSPIDLGLAPVTRTVDSQTKETKNLFVSQPSRAI